LYLGLGAGNNQWAASDPASHAGKVLRLGKDAIVAGGSGTAKQPKSVLSVYASGLGSPFGLAFHPLTGQLYVTDAGGGMDEINLVLPGRHYGAPAVGLQRNAKLTDPIAAHWPSRQISGLEFYRGDLIPEWHNDLFYCTARRAELHRVRLASPAFDRVLSDEIVTTGCQFAVTSGPDGALYFSDERAIYRLAP
jgi:glucose/arabinose dehydrogenase